MNLICQYNGSWYTIVDTKNASSGNLTLVAEDGSIVLAPVGSVEIGDQTLINQVRHLNSKNSMITNSVDISSDTVAYDLGDYGNLETVNLTTQGSTDWVHWEADDNDPSINNFVRKDGIVYIDNFRKIGTFTDEAYDQGVGAGRTYEWSNGKGTVSGSDARNYSGVDMGLNTGFYLEVCIPGPGNWEVKLYTGGWRTGTAIIATFGTQIVNSDMPPILTDIQEIIWNTMTANVTTISCSTNFYDRKIFIRTLVREFDPVPLGHITLEAVTLRQLT